MCLVVPLLNQGSLITSIRGTNDVATPHETRAAAATVPVTTAQRRGKDWKTQTKPFYEFKRRKELDGGAVAERCCYAMRGGSLQLGATVMTRS